MRAFIAVFEGKQFVITAESIEKASDKFERVSGTKPEQIIECTTEEIHAIY
jgi:hypothetical protein